MIAIRVGEGPQNFAWKIKFYPLDFRVSFSANLWSSRSILKGPVDKRLFLTIQKVEKSVPKLEVDHNWFLMLILDYGPFSGSFLAINHINFTYMIIFPPSWASSPAIAQRSSSRASSTINAWSGAVEAFLHIRLGLSRIFLKSVFKSNSRVMNTHFDPLRGFENWIKIWTSGLYLKSSGFLLFRFFCDLFETFDLFET